MEELLSRLGHESVTCRPGGGLAEGLAHGAGAALVTEESLAETDLEKLEAWLADQPPWSDFPFIILATKRSGRRPEAALRVIERLGNVVLLERPLHRETLASAVDSALRGRRRQYETRRHLHKLEQAEDSLRQLNARLEDRIVERTQELARANDQLMQEIAERERAQAALVQSQKMEAVGQLTGGIAHDFNNLLTVIGGNLELIQRRANDPRVVTLAEFASQATDRAGKLTRQLLAFSRTQRLTLKPVDINALVAGMRELLERTIGPMFAVRMDLDPSGPWAMADANQVELAILNLVINARDAMAGGGEIRISSSRQPSEEASLRSGDYVVIRVIDAGAGMSPALLERVFEPFFTTKAIGKGTGLGLSQVYGIAQQSGGGAFIDSIEGVGTTVAIWLPVAEMTTEAAHPPRAAVGVRQGQRERILVIEDDPGVRRFIVECLESLGYRVQAAAHGREGLDKLSADCPQLLIVDYAMPGMNGVEVVEAARLTAPDLPILLATGYADMEAVHRVVDAERVLKKPFQIRELEAAVRDALTQGA
ncbi:response regulator [Caulobacter sp. KR2-114]|uniref:response regulator n=1 Tax=Caulobacter sp. KR2-114 TaxID=3400912 RepID=UPI003C03BF4D